jgi:hypothetical protein
MVIKFEAVEIAEITCFIDAQDDGFGKTVKASEHMLWRYFGEVPGAYGVFDGFEESIFTDPPYPVKAGRAPLI